MPKCEIWSYGIKYGKPVCDDVIDVRDLSNPHHVPTLAPLTGKHERVQRWLKATPGFQAKLEQALERVQRLAKTVEAEAPGMVLRFGVGCYGGRHRSVVVADSLSDRLKRLGWEVIVHHRDVAHR